MKCFVYYVSCKFYNHSSHFFPSTKEFFVMVEMFKYVMTMAPWPGWAQLTTPDTAAGDHILG